MLPVVATSTLTLPCLSHVVLHDTWYTVYESLQTAAVPPLVVWIGPDQQIHVLGIQSSARHVLD